VRLEQSWLKWKHFNHAFCGKNKTIEPFHCFKIKVKGSRVKSLAKTLNIMPRSIGGAFLKVQAAVESFML